MSGSLSGPQSLPPNARVPSRALLPLAGDGSRPRRYLLSWGGEGWLAVTRTAVSDWRFQSRKVQKTSKTWKIQHEPSRLSDRRQIVVLRRPDVVASQSSLEPRQRVLGTSKASVPSRSRPPSVHEASPGYETTSWIDGREQAAPKGFNCCERVAAIAASLSLALLRIVPRPRVAPCDQSWYCVLRSAEMVVPGVAKDSAC